MKKIINMLLMLTKDELLKKYSAPVPRYTSYPTSPHFKSDVTSEVYEEWIATIPSDEGLSLYFHIPFCDTLCWFCGCHTKITRRYEPVQKYLKYLFREIELVAQKFKESHGNKKHPVKHIHWGGGSPTILEPSDIIKLANHIFENFAVLPDAEFAVEIDPRGMTIEAVRALADAGVTRASLGIQDMTEKVQKAINRIQPYDETKAVVELLRSEGITDINFDLIYGLPHQDLDCIRANVDAVKALKPTRLALFGYAHVPWMKTHMKMIPEEALPSSEERMKQQQLATELLCEAGYRAIGLDHFALPDDPLSLAVEENRLTRNFQGYTDDEAETLIGMGVSSIGVSDAGYIQNFPDMRSYVRAIDANKLPVAKGVATTSNDRMRRTAIQHVMCRYEVKLDDIAHQYGAADNLAQTIGPRLAEFEADGLISREGKTIKVTEEGKPFVRAVAALFDEYLETGKGKHSQAV
ncbi:oxygen-independent coproporphyrinogen III oxidase [Curvivirga aplysinae]|uniref:oxygen-independent coproporphyrinogen III oxidase n=1 Tax=Curvivirga aplysinae TaxID=2529852 RepID=UPI001F17A38F|nr:oxygen-independent coproporphyrinogen III oxidase [Curvivirga aplysinae]